MSQKYVVLADVDGKLRILSLRTNAPQGGIERLCHQMAEKFFAGCEVSDLRIEPWPLEVFRRYSPSR
ncbi:hypothetical protein MYX84_07620 [Acidobacteria bacterium AH-259-O06]|nr:hypothetical protein [Acidobacteria bacterium AH-259-O06]